MFGREAKQSAAAHQGPGLDRPQTTEVRYAGGAYVFLVGSDITESAATRNLDR